MKNVGSIALLVFLAWLYSGTAQAGWEGRQAEEVIATWGEPTKTKKRGKDGRVLVYRLLFLGQETVGRGSVRWSDLGIGPTPTRFDGEDRATRGDLLIFGAHGPKISGDQEIIATQKVKFFVDAHGVIVEEKIFPLKWKAKSEGP